VNPEKHGEIRIRAFNPYVREVANQNLITRDTLLLIKMLRAAGYAVVVEPAELGESSYVIRKGVIEFLEQPLVLLLIGIPLSIATGILANWISAELKQRKRAPQGSEINIVLETNEGGSTLRFNHRGEKIDEAQFDRVMSLFDKTATRFPLVGQSPYPEFPLSLYLEHSAKVVGWVTLLPDGTRTKAKGVIFDCETNERIESKELKGFSIAGIVRKSTCSICKSDFSQCEHVPSQVYQGRKCTNTIEKLTLTDVSVVTGPINRHAVISGHKAENNKKKGR